MVSTKAQLLWLETKNYDTVAVTGNEYLHCRGCVDFFLLRHTPHNSVSWTGFAYKKNSWALVDTKNGNKCFERVRNLPLGMLRVDHIIAVSQCGHRSVISCWYVHRVYSYVQLGLSPFCQPNNLQSKYTWTNWCLYKCRGQKYVRSRAIKAAVIWFIVPHIPPLPSPPKMIININGLKI